MTNSLLEKICSTEISGVIIEVTDSNGDAVLSSNNNGMIRLNDNYKLFKTFRDNLFKYNFKILLMIQFMERVVMR